MPGGFPLGLELCNGNQIGGTTSSRGTQLSLGTNTPGSWTQISSSTPYDACWIELMIASATNTNQPGFVDLGIGGSGSEKVICSNLGASPAASICTHFSFPMVIPAGTRVSARGQGAGGGSNNAFTSLILFDAAMTMVEGAAGVDSMGFVSASSKGTAVTPSTTANTKGSYAELTSATARDYIGLMVYWDAGFTGMSTSHHLMDIAIGGSGSEINIIPNLLMATFATTPYTIWPPASPFFPISIPAGTRIAARMQSSASSHPAICTTVYGVYQ